LLDRTIHWFYSKEQGRYLTLVVSAADALLGKSRREVIDLVLAELREFLPEVGRAKLLKAHVVKETRATFRARPGLEAKRPGAMTPVGNLFLAGDWTRSGWPATMVGAVRSGYLAAEAVSGFLGSPAQFLLPDIA
ncbi:MAG: FAD-dependent oxidoreductase, partial [Acidobacteriota bacterium]